MRIHPADFSFSLSEKDMTHHVIRQTFFPSLNKHHAQVEKLKGKKAENNVIKSSAHAGLNLIL